MYIILQANGTKPTSAYRLISILFLSPQFDLTAGIAKSLESVFLREALVVLLSTGCHGDKPREEALINTTNQYGRDAKD